MSFSSLSRLLVFGAVLFPFICSAQKLSDDFTVTTTEAYDVVDAPDKEYISLDNGTAILAKTDGRDVFLQKIDANKMKEVARNEYDDLPKKSEFLNVIKINDRVFYLYEVYNKKEKNFSVFSREINTTDATFKSPVELLKTSRKVEDSPVTTNMAKMPAVATPWNLGGPKFLVNQSFDDSKVMIHYRLETLTNNDKNNYDEFGFFVFDNTMKKVWGEEVKMPATEAEINNVGFAVSSSGDAKMLVANRGSKQYEVYTISNGKLTPKKLGISSDQLVRNMVMQEGKSGNFICGGIYANGMEFKMSFGGGNMVFNANGIMYFEMDKDGEVTKKQNFDFETDFIKQNLNDRLKEKVEEREEKGKAGILDLVLTDFSVKEDGSAFFVCERQWAKNEFYGMSQTMVYHFGNMVVVKINPDGALGWMKKMPKNQAGTKPGGGQMSLSYMEGNGADYIAYVDNPKNIDLSPEDGIPAAHKDGMGGFLTTYKVDHETGKLEKHTLCDLKDINGVEAYQFKPWRIFRVDQGVFLMEIYIKGKEDTMVKFELKG